MTAAITLWRAAVDPLSVALVGRPNSCRSRFAVWWHRTTITPLVGGLGSASKAVDSGPDGPKGEWKGVDQLPAGQQRSQQRRQQPQP